MTDTHVKPPRPAKTIPAEEVFRKIDDEDAALPPATEEELKAAFELIGNEMVRREVLARRAGNDDYSERLMFGMSAMLFAEGTLDEETKRDDFLWDAEDLSEELAELPPPGPDSEDPWVLKDQ